MVAYNISTCIIMGDKGRVSFIHVENKSLIQNFINILLQL